MGLNRGALTKLAAILSAEDVRRIEDNARIAEHVEQLWLMKLDVLLGELTKRIIDRLERDGDFVVPDDIETKFGEFFLNHELATVTAAARTIMPAEYVRAASSEGKDNKKWPSDSIRIREQWDEFRRTGKLPGHTAKAASNIKVIYIRRIQQWWQKAGRDFITGEPKAKGENAEGVIWNRDAFDRAAAVRSIQREMGVPRARARTIVETETTRYYNTTRVNTYNQIDSVVGYLYVIVRDAGTTKWCRSRAGMVLMKGSRILGKNTPPCFVGHSLVLTSRGWVPIDTVTVDDYVWTHAERWRRVKKVHRSNARSVDLFQIGSAVATGNHPYGIRGGGFIPAELFDQSEGICASSVDLSALRDSAVGGVVSSRSEILLDALSRQDAGAFSAGVGSPVLDRWQEAHEGWLRGYSSTESPAREQPGIRGATSPGDGADPRAIPDTSGDRAPHQRDQDRQSAGESGGHDKRRPHKTSPQGKAKKETAVYNLEVEEDHTYFCGGFMVHNCHWNCRSELLPLSRLNPAHRRLLEDQSLRAENKKLVPLPPGWNAAA